MVFVIGIGKAVFATSINTREPICITSDINVTGFSTIVHRIGVKIIQNAHQYRFSEHADAFSSTPVCIILALCWQAVGGDHHIHQRLNFNVFQYDRNRQPVYCNPAVAQSAFADCGCCYP